MKVRCILCSVETSFFVYILLRVEIHSRFNKQSIFAANLLWYTHHERMVYQ